MNFDLHDSYSKTIAVRTAPSLKNLSVFPNPANTETKIFWDNLNNSNGIDLKIMNAAMIPVLRQKVREGENFALIDVSRLPAGIYTIIISDANHLRETAKLLVK